MKRRPTFCHRPVLECDRFEVFDNGSSLGLTSAPSGAVQCGTVLIGDIGRSIANPSFSRDLYSLGSGLYSITLNYVTATAVLHTGAALQLTQATPEPGTCLLLSLGFIALTAKMRFAKI